MSIVVWDVGNVVCCATLRFARVIYIQRPSWISHNQLSRELFWKNKGKCSSGQPFPFSLNKKSRLRDLLAYFLSFKTAAYLCSQGYMLPEFCVPQLNIFLIWQIKVTFQRVLYSQQWYLHRSRVMSVSLGQYIEITHPHLTAYSCYTSWNLLEMFSNLVWKNGPDLNPT